MPAELDAEIAVEIALAYVEVIKPISVVMGFDARPESRLLYHAARDALRKSGVVVIAIGMCGSEELNFKTMKGNFDGGIIFTASHNPAGYGGMKMVSKGASPLTEEQYAAIKQLVMHKKVIRAQKFYVQEDDGFTYYRDEYIEFLLGLLDVVTLRPLKIVANFSNGPAATLVPLLVKRLPFEWVYLNAEITGQFAHGAPDPSLVASKEQMRHAILEHRADLGVAWDGDFDRCCFFTADGKMVEHCYIGALLTEEALRRDSEATVLLDGRVNYHMEQVLARYPDAKVVRSKAGHVFMKRAMRLHSACYGYENSGHHYFRELGYCDSGMLPLLKVVALLNNNDLFELVQNYRQEHFYSGEINYRYHDAVSLINALKSEFSNQRIDEFDGLSINCEDWRFNLRISNTEPLARLNIEAKNQGLLEQKRSLIERLLKHHSNSQVS